MNPYPKNQIAAMAMFAQALLGAAEGKTAEQLADEYMEANGWNERATKESAV